MCPATSGAPAAMKRRAMDPVHTLKFLLVFKEENCHQVYNYTYMHCKCIYIILQNLKIIDVFQTVHH
jgi:hypothetical protein